MKKLLIITALVEGMTGLFFLLLPSFMVSVLFGELFAFSRQVN